MVKAKIVLWAWFKRAEVVMAPFRGGLQPPPDFPVDGTGF